jgi:GAF domain-containing protein/HAMP domain-containing protein
MRNSLRTRLTVAFIGLTIVPLLLMGLVLAWQSFEIQQRQALTLQREVARRVSTAVDALIRALENDLRMIVEVQGLKGLAPDQQKSILSELMSYQPSFVELTLLDGQGHEQIRISRPGAVTPTQIGDRSQADEFVIPKQNGKTYFSPVRSDPILAEPFMTISLPLLDPESGQVDGVLIADARVTEIWDLMVSVPVSQGEEVYIVTSQGRVIAHRNPLVVLMGKHFDAPSQDGIHTGLNGTSVVLATDTLQFGEQRFTVVAEQATPEALALAIRTVIITAIITVIALMVAIGLGLTTVRLVLRPIEGMVATAQAIADGDLSQQVETTRRDEFGRLAQAFNTMTGQLRQTLSGLEQRVAERTADLERRSTDLQAAAEVGGAATSILETEQLIRQVVELIRERFGMYYVGLFIVDRAGEWAVLRAGTGEAGQAMLARNHRIKVGEGMIGWSVDHAQARVALEAELDAVRLATAELPETRSEAAIPLRSRGQTLGALTVQHTQPGAFDQDTLAVLQTMADQVAVALHNAELFSENQAALEASRRAYGELSRQAWAELLRARTNWGYRYADMSVGLAEGDWQPEMLHAFRTGQTVLPGFEFAGGPKSTQPEPDGHQDGPEGSIEGGATAEQMTLAIPLRVRSQLVGALSFRKGEKGTSWTAEEVALLENLVEQLGMALESARLYQDTQRRAARERLTREITGKIRTYTDLESILQTTVSEVSKVLGTHHGAIRLGSIQPTDIDAKQVSPESAPERAVKTCTGTENSDIALNPDGSGVAPDQSPTNPSRDNSTRRSPISHAGLPRGRPPRGDRGRGKGGQE